MKEKTMRKTIVFQSVLLFLFPWISLAESVTPENVSQYTQEVVNEVLKEYPQTAAAYTAQGYMFHRAKKLENAIQAFEKSVELDPTQELPTQMIAFIYNQLAQYDKAVEWYQKTLKLNPKAEQANERLGLALQKLNRMDEAMKAFEREIKNYPKDASAHVYLGERYLAVDRLQEAEEQAKLAAQNDSLIPEPYYLLGKIYRKQGQADKAKEMLDVFQTKKKEEQDYIEAHLVKSTEQEQANQFAAKTHNEVGAIYFRNNQFDKAESHYKTAIGLEPKNTEARYNLGMIYEQKNQLDKAGVVFQELVEIDPKEPRFLLGLGLIRLGQQQYPEAQELIEKTLSITPDNPSAKRALARILLSGGQNPQKAITILEGLVVADGLAIDYDLLGWAYYASGDIQKSLDALGAAIAKDPQNTLYRQRYEKLSAKLKK